MSEYDLSWNLSIYVKMILAPGGGLVVTFVIVYGQEDFDRTWSEAVTDAIWLPSYPSPVAQYILTAWWTSICSELSFRCPDAITYNDSNISFTSFVVIF